MGTSNAAEHSESRSQGDIKCQGKVPADETSPILRSVTRIDVGLLSMKIHYILAYGAVAGVIPYIPILGKQLGLTATAVGVVYTAQPFFVLFSKPAFGAITDHVRNLKAVLVFLIILEAIAYMSILLIPPLPQSSVQNFVFKCENDTTSIDVSQYNKTCLENEIFNFTCRFKFVQCLESNTCNSTCSSAIYSLNVGNYYLYGRSQVNFVDGTRGDIPYPSLGSDRLNGAAIGSIVRDTVVENHTIASPCDCGSSVWNATSCTPSPNHCLLEQDNREAVIYATYQFWLFTLLVIVSGACAAAVFTLTDTACYEMLGERKEIYGNQRLWGTVSWGLVNILTGYLNDMSSEGEAEIDYKPGFYILLSLLLLDLLLLYRLKLTKAYFTSTIFKDVTQLFVSPEIVTFTVAVFLVGALTGLLWNYQFWYLQNLGANQLLLGLTIAVQCLIAEVPLFYFSSYLIRKLGHYYCLIGTFVAYFIRYLLYFFLINPWYTLPIELLHGQTYAMFYATLVSFASARAPPGTEATMMSILGGMFEGLGVAVGSLLSGIGFDHLGDRNTFLTASVISAASSVVFLMIRIVLKRTTPQTASAPNTFTASTSTICVG